MSGNTLFSPGFGNVHRGSTGCGMSGDIDFPVHNLGEIKEPGVNWNEKRVWVIQDGSASNISELYPGLFLVLNHARIQSCGRSQSV